MTREPTPFAVNQTRAFLKLWVGLAPSLTRDRAFPLRLDAALRQHPEFGSRDRRLYRELIYTAARHLPWIESGLLAAAAEWTTGKISPASPAWEAVAAVVWLSADLPATRGVKAALVPDWPLPGIPDTVASRAAVLSRRAPQLPVQRSLLPDWFRDECPAAFDSPMYDTLNRRAPLWLRIDLRRTEEIEAEFAARGWTHAVSPILPSAWKMTTEADVTQTAAFKEGTIEIQDLGSQWVLACAQVQSGEQWFDACAGAGGKTLQLAKLVGRGGKVVADDIRDEALTELKLRKKRAGLPNITIGSHGGGSFDGVLVDAPCSGTGTWRRAPHLKWSTTSRIVADMARRQRQILDDAARNVRPGGRLIYATCSLCHTENEDIVSGFLADHPEFEPSPRIDWPGTEGSAAGIGRTLDPSVLDTDGFYAADLQRRA